MRAIDLYAGIGGWSLGLRLAGVEVVASYEWWQPAIDTHNGNHGGSLSTTDVRALRLENLPANIDLVVGSPPCTEFSYSNRGGGGNVDEGLKDLIKFLEIVAHLKPRFWALENVPRVAEVLRRGLADPSHPLHRFRFLSPRIEIVDFSDYGTPQSRRRCIAGNIPFDLIQAYGNRLPRRTLGDIIQAVGAVDRIVDPVWGCELTSDKVSDRETEPVLNAEELRMNREAKVYHPVYNNMAFPDVLTAPSRTVTATCTRVSRESIVIEDGDCGRYRRLSIRERACLQGFPITYQFYAKSFSDKAKMIGNAIPPTYTYLLAQAALNVRPEHLKTFTGAKGALCIPEQPAPSTPPTQAGRTYPAGRTFRAALPGLRFKSGMRFELANRQAERVNWTVRFFFGPSVAVREIALDAELLSSLRNSEVIKRVHKFTAADFQHCASWLQATSPTLLQDSWSHRFKGINPFEVVDVLGALAKRVLTCLELTEQDMQRQAVGCVMDAADRGGGGDDIPGSRKLKQNALAILAGMWVGAWFNELSWHNEQRDVA